MERTIRVTGKGIIKVKPDVIRISITLQDKCSEYEEAVRKSTESKALLNKVLGEQGFDAKDVKTLHFNIEPVYENYQTKDKAWRNRLVGFEYTHRMKLEFPADNERLGKVMYALAHCPSQPEFRIQYTLSDPEAAKNELLAKAVADSNAKAKVLSAAAGVTLKELINIDYSWGEIEFTSNPLVMGTKMMMLNESFIDGYDIDIEPDDIEQEDIVTMVWSIE